MSNTTNYSLSVSSQDGTPSASMISNDPQDLMRLLQLCGEDTEGKTYSLNVSTNDSSECDGGTVNASQNVSVSSTHPQDVARILQLCGLEASVPASMTDHVCLHCGQTPCVCSQVCDDCHQDPCVCTHEVCPHCHQSPCMCGQTINEQQSEYDYGHRDSKDQQTHFDMDDYMWKGRADAPERVTNARFGSNALQDELKDELKENIHQRLKKAYAKFVSESNEDMPNEQGRMSPLTSDKRQKFDKDPIKKEPDTTGEDSPMTTIVRQHIPR